MYKPFINKVVSDGFKSKETADLGYKELYLKDRGSFEDIALPHNDRKIAYRDNGVVTDSLFIEKCNFISYYGSPTKIPMISVLWYGKQLIFKDTVELDTFLSRRFEIRAEDTCPVCGNPRGKHLKFCFSMGAGLPFEVFPCSKECLKKLTGNINIYRRLLLELQQKPSVYEEDIRIPDALKKKN